MKTHAAFDAFAARVPKAAQAWLNRLSGIDHSSISSIVERIPPGRMSEIAREFTIKLFLVNQSILLER